MTKVPDGFGLDPEGKVVPIPDGWYVRLDGTLAEMTDFQKRCAARPPRPDPRLEHPHESDFAWNRAELRADVARRSLATARAAVEEQRKKKKPKDKPKPDAASGVTKGTKPPTHVVEKGPTLSDLLSGHVVWYDATEGRWRRDARPEGSA